MNYLEQDKDITELSNFKTPARAKYFFEVCSLSDIKKLHEVIVWAKHKKLSVLFVSWGSNMLFAFDEYEWIVVKNSLLSWSYDVDTNVLETESAVNIWEIAEDLEQKYRQDLWHRFIGLPGSVAWAIYWNAWCFWLETENNFLDCKVLNLDSGSGRVFTKQEMQFEYRSSRLKKEKKYFIISARFDLSKKIEKYHSDVDNIDFRKNKQPQGNSCGSFFKNPSKAQSAWYLIEQVWLKGYHIWGAYFSEKHANFLMHDGTGTYNDILQLIIEAQRRVQDKFWLMLENEVQIIYNVAESWQK